MNTTTTTTKVRPGYIYALAIAIGIGFAFTLAGCDDPELPPAPPVEPGATSSSHMLPTQPEPEPEACPWLGTCAELEHVEACDGWAVACGDGWRCVDTEADAGIVCEDLESSSSSGDAPEESETTT